MSWTWELFKHCHCFSDWMSTILHDSFNLKVFYRNVEKLCTTLDMCVSPQRNVYIQIFIPSLQSRQISVHMHVYMYSKTVLFKKSFTFTDWLSIFFTQCIHSKSNPAPLILQSLWHPVHHGIHLYELKKKGSSFSHMNSIFQMTAMHTRT